MAIKSEDDQTDETFLSFTITPRISGAAAFLTTAVFCTKCVYTASQKEYDTHNGGISL